MDKKLNWRHLKALQQIYVDGSTRNKVDGHPYFKFLVQNGTLQTKVGKKNVLEQGVNFPEYYQREHLAQFREYYDFLEKNKILFNQANFSERDILALMFVVEQKQQILSDRYSRKKLSALFFKEGAKHLDKHPGLEKAVLSILEINEFPGRDPKDQQYKFVVNCPNPTVIVLCENINFLLMPWISRENNVELWYAGGNNIDKLNYLPEITMPIYYSCDWDYHGLAIYERIKDKIPQIILLTPSAINSRNATDSPNHNSHWNPEIPFSGLNLKNFTMSERFLIIDLISKHEWIEEENNDLVLMLSAQRALQSNTI